MANALYDQGRHGFLTGAITWIDATNVKVALVDTGVYTVDLATHDNFDDVPSGSRVAVSGNLANKTSLSANGIADADDITLSSVAGASVEAIVIYKDTGSEPTSRLIAYIDTATGLPFTPSGGDVTIQWDNGGNKIFKL